MPCVNSSPLLDNQQPQAILFDLDGTLVDSVPDLTTAIDAMLSELGLAAAGECRVRNWVGNGALKLVERALAFSLTVDASVLDQQQFKQAHQLFLDFYSSSNGNNSRLYPGVSETLASLSNHNMPLAVVTNKPVQFVPALLLRLNIERYFKVLVGGECTAKRKPSSEPLIYACRLLAAKPSACLMVGDSIHDIQAAKAAGMPILAVDYGYNHGEDIRLSKPDGVMDNFSQLLKWVFLQ